MSSASNFNLQSILDRDKLNGTNFVDWNWNLRIIFRQEKKEYVLDTPYPEEPQNGAHTTSAYRAYVKHTDDAVDVQCLMLACMNPELQKQFESTNPYDMIVGLRGMFENQVRVGRFNTSKVLFGCKLAEGAPISPHVIKMIGCIESLQRLGFPLNDDLATDVVLQSLPDSFEPFILNYHMNGLKKSLTELHGILKTAEASLRKTSGHVMTVQKGKKRKHPAMAKKPTESGTSGQASKAKEKQKKAGASPDDACFHCGAKGHWSRNCKKYLEDKRKKGGATSTQGDENN
ncbi:uncharacterized protein [Setaria viridis]|uniref:uncharacterized protein n=1 Tax=Setaria viridis TaxID=4556 RepID=UPI001493C25B|nr:uncharacterized protein LOC117849097 [Setaria viridis]